MSTNSETQSSHETYSGNIKGGIQIESGYSNQAQRDYYDEEEEDQEPSVVDMKLTTKEEAGSKWDGNMLACISDGATVRL